MIKYEGHEYDVEIKAQSSQWKLPEEPRQKKQIGQVLTNVTMNSDRIVVRSVRKTLGFMK